MITRSGNPSPIDLGGTKLDGRTDEISANLRIGHETVRLAAREEEKRGFVESQIGEAGLSERQRTPLEQMQMTDLREVRRLTEVAGEKGSRLWRDVGKQ